MGLMTTMAIGELDLSLEDKIAMHLQYNFYPPIPAEMTQACIEALDSYYEDDLDHLIDMPVVNGFQVEWRGQTQAPTWAILEQHRLYGFIEEDED